MDIESNTLYRKYRPKNFDELKGQDEIIEILKKSIKNKDISHSYIFAGDRGTGKTSTARIFAKEIGCSPDDIYELDGASNRGIGEIREIRDSVNIKPISSDYKVYIIDEVHMLTKDAFNAILKTLEEPPKHVIFILATTELDKVLPTIISRCQVFEFKNPSLETLKDLIKEVVKKEGGKIDDQSAIKIAELAKGSFRDSLTNLQKFLTIFDGNIKYDKLSEFLGLSSKENWKKFLIYLSEKNKEKTFESYKEIIDKKINYELFIDFIIESIRKSLLIKNAPVFAKDLDANEKKFLENLNFNSLYLKKILELEELISISNRKEIAFEIFLSEFFD